MAEQYFRELRERTQTRFWINNPTAAELGLAMEQGAVSCTTNPAYCARLIASEPEYIRPLIDAVIRECPDCESAAVLVYQRACGRIMQAYADLHQRSAGTAGFVTIQDDPRHDADMQRTVAAAMANRQLGANFMAKIPVIAGGIEAIEACVEANMPVCATEVFSIAQAMYIDERYAQASRRADRRPPFYLTHISGIFDEYLEKVAAREGIVIDPDILHQAGLTVARKQYAMLHQRGSQALLLGGGARGTHHFTGLVGGNAHITINWSTAREIMDSAELPQDNLMLATPQRVIDELREKFPDFRIAYDDNGHEPADFADYGPVQLFRNAFLKGWYLLLAEIASRRNANAL
jgi:transaldolase